METRSERGHTTFVIRCACRHSPSSFSKTADRHRHGPGRKRRAGTADHAGWRGAAENPSGIGTAPIPTRVTAPGRRCGGIPGSIRQAERATIDWFLILRAGSSVCAGVGGDGTPLHTEEDFMLSTSRARVRALAVVGMFGVVAAIGTVTYQASAAEVAAPVAPAAFGPDSRQVAIPGIPAAIKPPKGARPLGAYVVATGTQTYKCTGGIFTGASTPEARLVGTGGKIHHFGGPSWQSERDGSLVTAKKTAESPRAGTIPELLLTVDSHSGTGILSKAAYINRLQTSGGVAPAGSCTDGSTTAVPYRSVYVFWSK